MVWYRMDESDSWSEDDVSLCASRLLTLKDRLIEWIPQRHVSENLLLATWNIKEFGGRRDTDAVQYIAEVVSRFDVIAIQEVKEDLSGLEDLLDCLGSWYDAFYTDVTAGEAGNGERMAFVYDSRKVQPTGLVGEVVIPPDDNGGNPAKQLVRTPMVVGFRSGWFTFNICIVHIFYGGGAPDIPERVGEIWTIAEAMKEHALAAAESNKNATTLLLGDFNIFSPDDVTFESIENAGFVVDERLQELPTNAGKKERHYDQIAMYDWEWAPRIRNAGVLDLFEVLYTDEDEALYAERMGRMYTHNSEGERRPDEGRYDSTWYYQTHWRTRRLSDHLPMWVEFRIDQSARWLESKVSDENRVELDQTSVAEVAPAE